MLLSLPVELVERIVRLALPVDPASRTYRRRQATLRACCLVSSGMKDVAQPILEEALWIRHDRGIIWDEARAKLSRTSKRLRFLGLRELHLCGWRRFSLCTLKGLADLRYLILSCVHLDSSLCTLPQIEESSIDCVHAPVEVRPAILTPTTFPSLQHLALDPGQGSPMPDSSLISSLVSFTLDETAITEDMTAFDHPSTPRLVQAYEEYPERALWVDLCKHVEHVQIFLELGRRAKNELLEMLANALEDRSGLPSIRLRLVYLPSAFSSCTCDTCEKCNNLARFRRACAARDISVDTEDHETQYEEWAGSRKFMAYAEQKERERAAEALERARQASVGRITCSPASALLLLFPLSPH
ncbi:hypothetical protein JCM10213v2_003271 [Rhodosporidiobolus nylandii]